MGREARLQVALQKDPWDLTLSAAIPLPLQVCIQLSWRWEHEKSPTKEDRIELNHGSTLPLILTIPFRRRTEPGAGFGEERKSLAGAWRRSMWWGLLRNRGESELGRALLRRAPQRRASGLKKFHQAKRVLVWTCHRKKKVPVTWPLSQKHQIHAGTGMPQQKWGCVLCTSACELCVVQI